MKRYLIVFVMLLAFFQTAYGQDDRVDRLGFGVGPSKIYGDNTGRHRAFKFRVLPSISLDYNKKIDTHFDAKLTIGWQMISSGDFYPEPAKNNISLAGVPYGFDGNVIFADLMPIYYFNPDQSGYLPSMFKVYGGLGLGVFHSARTDRIRVFQDEDRFTTNTYRDSNTNLYVPIRIGVFKSLKNEKSEIGLEGTLLLSPFGELEGNNVRRKSLPADMLMQLQVFYRINIGE
ncbi:hypothetical protein [Pleomorphovibrio marinus]|uniref:hypothetical protein n=1 Tax=Pleomorphovibrio marinus TaxID=2164132 RepID=UPI000E0A9829|nr:hypothetical protein [Pleomorphovibrio marinus]